MAKKIKKKVARTVIPYIDLYHAAKFSIERLENSEEPEFYCCMSTILFCAFCIEAYLNHIGRAYFVTWDNDLEKLSPKAKLNLITSERIGRKPDFSRRPFQSFNELVRFRNDLAHGKTETVQYTAMFEDTIKQADKPLTHWEKLCSIDHTKRLFDDTRNMILMLHSHTPVSERNPFGYYDVTMESVIFDDPTQNDSTSPEDFVY